MRISDCGTWNLKRFESLKKGKTEFLSMTRVIPKNSNFCLNYCWTKMYHLFWIYAKIRTKVEHDGGCAMDFYTILTRAREKVEVWGTEEIIQEAVSHRIERTSGLRKTLWGRDIIIIRTLWCTEEASPIFSSRPT